MLILMLGHSYLQSGVSSQIARQFPSDGVKSLNVRNEEDVFLVLIIPVVNIIVFLQRTLRFLDQLGNTGSQMITLARVDWV